MRTEKLVNQSGLVLSIGISMALTISFFASLANSKITLMLFCAIALVFELLKIRTLQVLPRVFYSKKQNSFVVYVVLYGLLALLSFCASLGSLTSNATQKQNALVATKEHNALIQKNIDSINEQIEQNNKSIAFYRSQNLLQLRVIPLQNQNTILRLESKKEQNKMLSLPTQSAINSVINSIATAFAISYSLANTLLSSLLSMLLEIACAVFLLLSIQESKKEQLLQSVKRATTLLNNNPIPPKPPTAKKTQNVAQKKSIHSQKSVTNNIISIHSKKNNVKKVFNGQLVTEAIVRGQLLPNKRAILNEFSIGAKKLTHFFLDLEQQQIISKNNGLNGRYVLNQNLKKVAVVKV